MYVFNICVDGIIKVVLVLISKIVKVFGSILVGVDSVCMKAMNQVNNKQDILGKKVE